jgi:Co/Zn/Cd efflux system component
MKSTFICSRNDIISNTGVLFAAFLVQSFSSKWPDIAIGYIISILFFKSAWPILKESIGALKAARAEAPEHTQHEPSRASAET